MNCQLAGKVCELTLTFVLVSGSYLQLLECTGAGQDRPEGFLRLKVHGIQMINKTNDKQQQSNSLKRHL